MSELVWKFQFKFKKLFFGFRENKTLYSSTNLRNVRKYNFIQTTRYNWLHGQKARKIVKDEGNYSSPNLYLGLHIDENVQKVVLQYYLNDDSNYSTQSPNKNNTINHYENGEKIVKVKRFMSRRIHKTYKIFKRDHPDMKIGHSKFYTLRPKWVVQFPAQRVYLCIYCTNFELLLVGLKVCLNRFSAVVVNVRETILSLAICSIGYDLCIFKECVKCPRVQRIIEKLKLKM